MIFKRLPVCLVLATVLAPGLAAQDAKEPPPDAIPAPQLGWPREYTGEDHRLVMCEPGPMTTKNNRRTAKGAKA